MRTLAETFWLHIWIDVYFIQSKLKGWTSKHRAGLQWSNFSCFFLFSLRWDCCNGLLTGFNQKALNQLQMVKNSAARLLRRTKNTEHITPVLMTLHWRAITSRTDFQIIVITLKALHDLGPEYILKLLFPYQTPSSLRCSGRNVLTVPTSHLKTNRGFAVLISC